MSLDVYLHGQHQSQNIGGEAIFIREHGQTVQISREEWDRRFPEREPFVVQTPSESDVVYEANITHNLNTMATEAGIYRELWRPEELGITKASQLIEPLSAGLTLLQSDPARFEAFNPSNGWGNYDGLVAFVAKYLEACRANPDATISVSR